ncbi:hypothetical protein [Spirosoma areae]
MQNEQVFLQDFLLQTQKKQQQEVQRNQQNYNNCVQMLRKYDQELMGESQPNLFRLRQMKRNVQRFAKVFKTELKDLNDKDIPPTVYHAIELPSAYGQMSYSQFYDWKKELIDKALSRFSDSMEIIDSQIEHISNRPDLDMSTLGSIADFLTDEGCKLIPFIKDKYTDTKPAKGLTALIIALENLKLFKVNVIERGVKVKFHRVLSELLGKIGGLSTYEKSLPKYNMGPDKKKSDEIKRTIDKLVNELGKQ